jgi:hypothetical protein
LLTSAKHRSELPVSSIAGMMLHVDAALIVVLVARIGA